MKIRNGFVSNSSSSSFMVRKDNLSDLQIRLIVNHALIVNSSNDLVDLLCPGLSNLRCRDGDEWSIDDTGDFITGYTSMDNFDMYEYLRLIGVDEHDICMKY